MVMHWNVLVTAKITDLNVARNIKNEHDYDILPIRGSWYILDPELVLETFYPGGKLTNNYTIEYLTPDGMTEVTFDTTRLEHFLQIINKHGWEICIWESFSTDYARNPRYTRLSNNVV